MKNTTNNNPKFSSHLRDWHITGSELVTILECAQTALADADFFDDMANKLDIEDSEMKVIQERLNDDPATMYLVRSINAHNELVTALKMFVDATHNMGENPRKTAIDTQLHANAFDFAVLALNKVEFNYFEKSSS